MLQSLGLLRIICSEGEMFLWGPNPGYVGKFMGCLECELLYWYALKESGKD